MNNYLDRAKFADRRIVEALARAGGQLLPMPRGGHNVAFRRWQPLWDGDKEVRIRDGDWVGELGWGSGGHAACGFIRHDRLQAAELTKGMGANIPFCALRFSQFWIFDSLAGDGEEIKNLRAQQWDLLNAILDLNGVGKKDAPKSHTSNMTGLMTAGMNIGREALAQIGVFSSAPVRKETPRVVTQTTVTQIDGHGREIGQEERTELLTDGGGQLDNFKRN